MYIKENELLSNLHGPIYSYMHRCSSDSFKRCDSFALWNSEMLHGMWTLSSPLSLVWWYLFRGPDLGLAKFFYKKSDRKYFRLCMSYSLCCILGSAVVLGKQPQTIQKWVGVAGFQQNLICKNRHWAGYGQGCRLLTLALANICHFKFKVCLNLCVKSNLLLIMSKL